MDGFNETKTLRCLLALYTLVHQFALMIRVVSLRVSFIVLRAAERVGIFRFKKS